MWRATVLDERGQKYELADGTATIGRDSTCTITLNHPSVSRTHAVLHIDGELVTVTDDGSTHGSSLGGVALRKGIARRIVSFTELRVGSVPLEFERADAPNADLPNTRELALEMVARAPAPAVVVVEGPDVGRRVALDAVISVGRDPSCSLALSDPSVSSDHVEIAFGSGRVSVRDRGSKHGSAIGAERLVANQPTPWPPDRCVAIGQTVLALENVARERRVEIESQISQPAPLQASALKPVEPLPDAKVVRKSRSIVPGLVAAVLGSIVALSLAALVWFLWPRT